MMTQAIYEKGQLRLLTPLDLPEGVCLDVHVEKSSVAGTGWDPEVAKKAMREIQALADEGKDDNLHVARDHDHYLYGAPRRG